MKGREREREKIWGDRGRRGLIIAKWGFLLFQNQEGGRTMRPNVLLVFEWKPER